MVQQPNLFDVSKFSTPIPSTPKISQIKWSYSRRDLLEQCPRRYYYNYYGASQKVAPTDPDKLKIQFLKPLSNRHLIAGQKLHHHIRQYFRKKTLDIPQDLPEILKLAQDDYHRSTKNSQRSQRNTNRINQPKTLMESYYKWENAEALIAETEQQFLSALTHFISSSELASFRLGGSHPDALVEKRISLKDERFSMGGQIDLAYPQDDRLIIVDWKIGGYSNDNDNLQLLSYAWWVVEKSEYKPNQIDLYQIHLASLQIQPFTTNEQLILRAKARILQDIERMRTLDKYGQEGIAKAFTPCGQTKVCQLCPYQEICPKE